MEKILSESIVGQPKAVKALANAIHLLRSSLGNTQRPIASSFMAGPSDKGKTLLSKTVSTDGLRDQNSSLTHNRCSLRLSSSIPWML